MLGAIVLGGGRSLRMGADKLALRLDGDTLLARTCAAAATVAERVVVAGPEEPGLSVRKLLGGLILAHLAAPDAVTRDIDTPYQARSAGLT